MKNLKLRFVILALSALSCSQFSVASELLLPIDSKVFTKESILEDQGIQYRKVEYQGKNYFFRLLGPKTSGQDLALFCNQPGQEGFTSPPMVKVGLQTVERSRLFIEALELKCKSPDPNRDDQKKIMALMPYLAVGFSLDGKENPKAILKNKKLLINPFGGVMFRAEM